MLRFDSESEQESKANEDSIEEVISIQNQIIVENWMNQLCINIQAVMKQNRRTCQDIDLNNCKVLDEVLWKDDRLWIFSVNDHSIDKKSTWSFDQWTLWHESNIELAEMIILLIKDENDNQALHLKMLRLL